VSTRTNTQPEEEDPMDEGTENEGRSGQEGKDEHFNTIWSMIPMKQDWRVEEKTSVPILIASDDYMDLLDDDESPLINMVLTLPD
jgi:hypothetical protein